MLRLPFIDRIWTARGFIELDPPRAPADVFARLDPLLQAKGTGYDVDGNTLTYRKDNPAAQDKLATFTRGTLQVVQEGGQSILRYRLTSPALLMVFLAPLLFLMLGQVIILVNQLDRGSEEEKATAEKQKQEEKDEEPPPLNFIDQALGAPAPESLEEKKKREQEEGKKEDGELSPKPAYVFAGIFAVLFLVGRFLEPWLIKRTFRRIVNGLDQEREIGADSGAEAGRPA